MLTKIALTKAGDIEPDGAVSARETVKQLLKERDEKDTQTN